MAFKGISAAGGLVSRRRVCALWVAGILPHTRASPHGCSRFLLYVSASGPSGTSFL